jgi:hypothetical protein
MLTEPGGPTDSVVAAIGHASSKSAVDPREGGFLHAVGWATGSVDLSKPNDGRSRSSLPRATGRRRHPAADWTNVANWRRFVSVHSHEEMSVIRQKQRLARRRSHLKLSPFPAAGLLSQPNTDWIVRLAPARGSWHGLSIEDAFLAFVGIVFVLILLRLTSGDTAD